MTLEDRLRVLDEAVEAHLRGAPAAFEVLGYGEISAVLRLDDDRVAKRLPPMSDTDFIRYAAAVDDYVAALGRRGVEVADTELRRIETEHGTAVYMVQPRHRTLLTERLAAASPDEAAAVFAAVGDLVVSTVDGTIGLDAQVSNWALAPDGRLVYFDVTTPLLRRADGSEALDTDLFLASLPAPLRAPVRRFALPGILATYYDVRRVLLDIVGNLGKERVDVLVPAAVAAFAEAVDDPITAGEARRYYRANAILWEMLQRLRRADRWGHRRRGAVYPFLLPPRIAR